MASLEASTFVAGWSSPVARQAHNLKVVGSNPTPATKLFNKINDLYERFVDGLDCFTNNKVIIRLRFVK